MSKRGILANFVTSIVLTILLEVQTSEYIHYGAISRIITCFLFLAFISMAFSDLYYIIKSGAFQKYHQTAFWMNISVVVVIVLIMLTGFCTRTQYRIVYAILMVMSIILTAILVRRTLQEG